MRRLLPGRGPEVDAGAPRASRDDMLAEGIPDTVRAADR
jgi:hypothetical protein